eukprot:TRINITY_DN9555_c0_g1_i1.p1 TRINITY_DN9555_c0_g1~~TRINITY_DN9555_c0_g1_i1.p1  ORF type:complete len:319 (-),score=58.30 TRINITY_DN9555_c0_g1_i1:325-1281(-)
MAAMPHFDLVAEIANGGQAIVYRAVAKRGSDEKETREEHVAVKVYQSAGAQASAQSEIGFLKTVQGHRSIVRLLEGFGIHEPNVIVLEFCPEDLFEVALARQMTEVEVVDIIRDMLSALQHVHARGIVHRDVKPENIAFGHDSIPRLIDFGVAAFACEEDRFRTFPRTVGYAAPELLKKQRYSYPVDIFALGASLYFALGQRLAFATSSMSEKSIAAKTKKGCVSFGKKFDNISDNTKEAIRWLMRDTASWRPTASEALLSVPFSIGADVHCENEHTCASSTVTPIISEVTPTPPPEAKKRSARPAPRARKRPEAEDK